jgi:hypothetical protein
MPSTQEPDQPRQLEVQVRRDLGKLVFQCSSVAIEIGDRDPARGDGDL